MEKLYAMVFFLSCLLMNTYGGAQAIGINYGLVGDNLPQPSQAISLLKSVGISKVRVFEPNPDVLTALQNSGISVIIGTRNEDLQSLASDPTAAATWVSNNITPYTSLDISLIAAGNEVIPGDLGQYVPGAIQNLNAALSTAGLPIPVTTVVSMAMIGSNSFPPSAGVFSAEASSIMTQVAIILSSTKTPLLANCYTWFPRVSDPTNVPLDYALLNANAQPVIDGSFTYTNLFDAMVDTVYAALASVGASDVDIIVSETGWPTEGHPDASVDSASTFNNNLVQHLSSGQGTPRRPGTKIEAYIFALFKENQKPEGVERNWGLFYPDMTEVYHVNFA